MCVGYLDHSVVLLVEPIELFDVLVEVLELLLSGCHDGAPWYVHLNNSNESKSRRKQQFSSKQ
jgi:hypothetical protein